MTTAQPSNTIAGPAAGRQVNPSEVGWQFVPQYYTFVNKHPHRLHCFYTRNSTFIHGTEGEDGKACYGQHEIHNKILSLNYNDCKVFIHSVDAQSSANNGIIIQVIGEMSNRGEPWKKFVQTFFLAEQPNGYFVLNDIFRFLKEDSVGEEEEEEETVIEEAPSGAPPVLEEPLRYGEQLPSPTVSNTAPVEQVVNSYEPEDPVLQPIAHTVPAPPPQAVEPEPTPAPEPVSEPVEEHVPHVNGINGHADHAASVEEEEEKGEAAPTVHHPEPEPELAEPPVTVVEPSPAPEPAAPTVKTPSPIPPITSTPAAAPAPAAPAPSAPASAAPEPAPVPSGPKTWATLAASSRGKWGNQIATEAKGVSAAAPQTPTPAPVAPKVTTNGKPAPAGDATAASPAALSTGQCFVKAVTENVNETVLRDALVSRFGPVKELEIVRSKACAFLEFNSPEAARKAIQVSLPVNQGGEGGIRLEGKPGPNGLPPRVIVETRKERGDRPISTRGRGGPPGGGGGEGRGASAAASGGEGRGGPPSGRGRGSMRGRGAPPPK